VIVCAQDSHLVVQVDSNLSGKMRSGCSHIKHVAGGYFEHTCNVGPSVPAFCMHITLLTDSPFITFTGQSLLGVSFIVLFPHLILLGDI